MDDNIKNEFKDFVSKLSKEICKDVLLDELKSINSSFNETGRNYKDLYYNYSNNVTTVKNQLIELKNTNQNLNTFMGNINDNNDKINDALTIINGEHIKAIETIIEENKSLLNDYSDKVQTLNKIQKAEFISQLTSSIDKSTQKYILDLKNLVNGINMKTIYGSISNDIDSLSKSINLIYLELEKISEIVTDVESNTVKQLNKSLELFQNISSIRSDETNGKINHVVNQMNSKFTVLSTTINQKNNIIIGLITFIILLCFGILTI